MAESKRQQARRLFMEVAELSESERAVELARACGSDAALRAEVEALLKAERDAGAFLSRPTAGEALKPAENAVISTNETAGALIGRYKLLEQIGEGGMGTIWMAEQREPVKRRVALKIIKLGMDTKQVIARFEAERQALAMMDHPHIAKVLDAGATETGRPYFVMEYIKGIPILEYCDKERLDTRARLALFTSVCHAIQHAHQKGIIHRDIKPSNVLVTLHDGVPVTKVIDFGIAKATNSELTTKTLFTEHRQMIGTPAYMSPEQAEMSGLDIDTRSDVYSLGVLLYELLTGTTPFDTKALLESGYAEMLRAIREDEPHKPSTRISSLGDTGTRTGLQRRADIKRLSLLMRGDLDWIVMKCLEKDRQRRYDTANGVAADIARHLRDEPITAGAPSAGYKLRKFVKRNRAKVIAASTVFSALLIGTVGTSWGLVEKNHARSAQVQRKLENDQLEAAERDRLARNADAVTALLDQCEAALRAGDAAKAKISMDAASKRAADGGAETTTARVSRLSADLDLVVELDAIDQFRWTWTKNQFAPMKIVVPRMREALRKFGVSPETASLESATAAVNASAVRDRIVAVLDWVMWERSTKEATLGAHALLRRLDDDPYRNEVRDTFLTTGGPDQEKFIELSNRPTALEQPPEFVAYLGEFNQVDERRRVELLQLAVLRRPTNLALLMTLGRLTFATPDPKDELRWCQSALAAAPTSFASYANLGVALESSGRLNEAITCQRRAIELDPKNSAAYLNLANALALTGQLEAAVENHRKAIELEPENFENYCCFGNTLTRQGRFDEAVECLKHAIELDPKHAEAHYNMGFALQSHGKLPEALASYRQAFELDPKYFEACINIGVTLRNLGRSPEALGYFEKAVTIDPKSSQAQSNLGGVLFDLGRREEGLALCKLAVELDPKSAKAYYNLGNLSGAEDWEQAAAYLRKSIELDPSYAEAHCNLAQLLIQYGHEKEALAEYELCHELGSKRADWNYPLADWIRKAKAKVAEAAVQHPKVDAWLAGEHQPKDDAERLELAGLCQNSKLNHAAAALYAEVLDKDPAKSSLENALRYNAACVAALSAAGDGEDSASLDEKERARLRKQAHDWLRADLNEATRRFESGNATDRGIAARCVGNLSRQIDLVSIRDAVALDKLPAEEGAEFTQLWADMAALLKKAQSPKAKPSGASEQSAKQFEQTILSFNSQGNQLQSEGKHAEAERAYAQGLDACQRAFEGPHPLTAMLLHHHAEALRSLGRLDDALTDAQSAVSVYREHPEASSEGAHAMSVLLSILRELGRANEGVAARREWITSQRRILPPASAELAIQLRILGDDVLKMGTLDDAREAEALLREALEIRIKAIPGNWLVHSSMSLLGSAIVSVVELDPALTKEARDVRLREAERLLLDAYAGMKDNPTVPMPAQTGGTDRRREALERVVRLYEVWNRLEPSKDHDAKAAEWRKTLDTAYAPATQGDK